MMGRTISIPRTRLRPLPASRPLRHDPFRGRPTRPMGIFALVLTGMIAVASYSMAHTTAPTPPDVVGICHATGSEEQPFVYVIVARNGYDHGHHEQHAEDRVGVASEADCLVPPADTAPADAEAAELPYDSCGFETETVEVAASEPDELPLEEAEADAVPETVELASTEEEEFCPGDVALALDGGLVAKRLTYTFGVASLGPDEANAVVLEDELPDTGRTWRLSGADADACTLAERALRCEFGDLSVGETRSFSASSLRCPHDCGDDLENAAAVTAFNDADGSNNAASYVLEVVDCPETAPPAEQLPAEDPSGNATAPPAEEPPAGNGTSTEPEPAPLLGNVVVSSRSVQDDELVTLVLTVANRDEGNATGVGLRDEMPDVRRSWFLTGADASDCTLTGRTLTCGFGTLAPGEERTVSLRAYTDRMPCGQHLVNTVDAMSDSDADASDNASSSGIEAERC